MRRHRVLSREGLLERLFERLFRRPSEKPHRIKWGDLDLSDPKHPRLTKTVDELEE